MAYEPLCQSNCLNENFRRHFVVLGAGINGAAAAFQLSELLKVERADYTLTVLERGEKDLPTGSSAGETRITRKVSFENPHVIPGMVEFSNAVLLTLGAVKPVPTVLIGNNPRYFDNAITAAVASNAPYCHLHEETQKQIPYVKMDGLEGILEGAMDKNGNGAGTLDPTLAIKKMLEKAEQNGATVRFNSMVESLTETADGKVQVKIEGGATISADRIISAAGVWNDKFIGTASTGSLHTKSKVLKVFWFKIEPGSNLADFPNLLFKIKGGREFAEQHPDFATKHPTYDFSNALTEEGIYMLQEKRADGSYLKFGHIQPVPKIKEHPDVILARESITREHEAFIAGFVREFMPGVAHYLPDVSKGRASFTKTYLESFSNDFMPVIGPRSVGSNVITMTGFSGIGAKFAVASGRYAALYALNKPELIPENARSLFSPARKELRPKPPITWQINGNLGAPGPDGTVQTPPCLDMGLLGERAAALYRNGYPANAGIPEARAAAANMFNRFKNAARMPGVNAESENIYLATGGATDATQIAIEHVLSKLRPGSKPRAVLITPVYHLYIGQLTQNDIRIEFLDVADKYCAEDNSITSQSDEAILAGIRQTVTTDTCLLFVNSPRNPDGRIFSRALLYGILEILDDNQNLRIISDTIYKEVAPAGRNVTTLFGLATAEQRERIYETDGTSKSVAKTMDRAAWLISSAKNIVEIAAVSHLKRGRPALPQMLQIVSMDEYLATSAPDYAAKNSDMYLGKLRYVAAAAMQVEALHCSPYVGAYYGYLDFRAVQFGTPMTPVEKENALVDALVVKGIAVSPGSIFKHPGAIRFNSSFNNRTLQRLMGIIVDTFAELGAPVTKRDIPLPVIDSPDYDFQPYPLGCLATQKPDVLQMLKGGRL